MPSGGYGNLPFNINTRSSYGFFSKTDSTQEYFEMEKYDASILKLCYNYQLKETLQDLFHCGFAQDSQKASTVIHSIFIEVIILKNWSIWTSRYILVFVFRGECTSLNRCKFISSLCLHWLFIMQRSTIFSTSVQGQRHLCNLVYPFCSLFFLLLGYFCFKFISLSLV